MYVRLVVPRIHPESRVRLGVIHAAYSLLYDELADDHGELIRDTLTWFSKKLRIPTYYLDSRHPRARARAICWFKPHASEHIRRARDLQYVLEYHDAFVETIWCRRPGYVVYEDEHQIAACPFKETTA